MNITAEQHRIESLLSQAAVAFSEIMKGTTEQLEEAKKLTFKGKISTIPALLVKTRGNQTEAARVLGTTRSTIHKYARDIDATEHVIVNGVLMINRGKIGAHMREKANAATS